MKMSKTKIGNQKSKRDVLSFFERGVTSVFKLNETFANQSIRGANF